MKHTLANLYKSIKSEFKRPFVLNTFGDDFRIYLYLGDQDGFNFFKEHASDEGITFGDGKNLSEKPYDDVLALNEDLTVNYIGRFGHTAFRHPEASSRYIVRVDYRKYIEGDQNYLYQPTA